MWCEKMHARIRVSQCLANQECKYYGGHRGGAQAEWSAFYPSCKGCEQGALARAGMLSDADVEELKRDRMRMEEGKMVNKTVGEVPAQPEAAPPESTIQEAGQGAGVLTKVCKRCSERGPQPIEDFHRNSASPDGHGYLCKACVAKRDKERNRKRKDTGRKAKRTRREAAGVASAAGSDAQMQGTCAQPYGSLKEEGGASEAGFRLVILPESVIMLNIDLTRYPEIYERIEKYAEEHDRTPEGQVRNWLRNHLGTLVSEI